MRLTRKIAALAAGTALLAGTVLATAPAANATAARHRRLEGRRRARRGYGDGSNGNPYDFQILTTAVVKTGLVPTVQSLNNVDDLRAERPRRSRCWPTSSACSARTTGYGATVERGQDRRRAAHAAERR